ncbi:MAG: dienelactone hydrolase family protein [Rickettsiaceae bacterium]|nr:dienelactone hydrolase family protein [Rickettsiaceae bacterium]
MNYSELKAAIAPTKKLLVMLHGVGSDGEDLITLAPIMSNNLPHYHFFSPNGIEKYDMAPFGYQWFSLRDRSWPAIMPQITKNTVLLQKIITAKQLELNLTNAQTILLGFSQGTMMASYLTLTADRPYYAMIGFSGRLVPAQTSPNHNTPICLIHGLEDSVITCSESEKFYQYAIEHNIACHLKIVDNLAHSIDITGIDFAINFLKNLEDKDEQ